MAWLLRRGSVLASVEFIANPSDRSRVTTSLDVGDAVIWRTDSRIAHTFGVKRSLDVAYLDDDNVVIAVTGLGPMRLGRPRWRSAAILEGRSGAFAQWNLQPGDPLEIRE